ncbi:MAG: 4'-phosphopantetheinyl transferase family protein [Bdellovibrionota bacterium]
MQYIVARGLLRSYLSKKLSKPSSEINISVAKNGAILVHEIYNDSKIFASISHSESKVIVALDNFPLGVDVEYKKERKDFLKLAKYAFNEREEFLKIKNAKTPKMQMELFYKGWTKKEALYKLNSLLENYNFKLDSQKIKFIEKKLFDNYVVMVAR